ncbi:hypothetical protein D3C84_875090 [compost metagenome]
MRQAVEAEVGVLAGAVRQAFFQLDDQSGDVVGQPVLRHHLPTHLASARLAGEIHFDVYIPPRHALAGEDVAGVQLFIGQDVARLGQFTHAARHQLALAAGTSADTAAVGKVDAMAQGGLQQRLFRINPDADPVDQRSGWAMPGKERKHASSCSSYWRRGSGR